MIYSGPYKEIVYIGVIIIVFFIFQDLSSFDCVDIDILLTFFHIFVYVCVFYFLRSVNIYIYTDSLS